MYLNTMSGSGRRSRVSGRRKAKHIGSRTVTEQTVPNMVEAYCVKCQENVEVRNAEDVTMKNGQPATRGECPNCGTQVFRIKARD